jgi:hypothetical protein
MKEFIKESIYVLLGVIKYAVIGWIVAVVTCLIAKDSANYDVYFVYGMVISLAVDFLSDKYKNKKK